MSHCLQRSRGNPRLQISFRGGNPSVHRRRDNHTVPDQNCKMRLHDAIGLPLRIWLKMLQRGFTSRHYCCKHVISTILVLFPALLLQASHRYHSRTVSVTVVASKSSLPFSYCFKSLLHTVFPLSLWTSVNILGTDLPQSFQLQLFQHSAYSHVEWEFSQCYTLVSQNEIINALRTVKNFALCDLPLRIPIIGVPTFTW